MQPILEEIENYKKKAVSNARAIFSNQVAMPFGAVRMNRIIIWSQKTNALKEVNMEDFTKYTEQLNACPIGTARLLWNKKALIEQDRIIDEIMKQFHDLIIDKCFEILDRFVTVEQMSKKPSHF